MEPVPAGGFALADVAARLGAACIAGLALGLDRELRGMPAGLRTHALVSLSAASIMVSALMLYADLPDGGDPGPDVLRVVQGLAQAVGFVAAGVVFVSRGGVRNLTTAANLWLATGAGIAAGAGQLALAAVSVALGVAVLVLVRAVELVLPGSRKAEDRE
jgi:putative Mg2+ transporter-C (MgtC) family protein